MIPTGASLELIAEKIPHLSLLVLFGSRAKGQATQQSDWDLAFLADSVPTNAWGEPSFLGTLAEVLQIPRDRLDWVDLARCSPLLAHGIAREGKVLYQSDPFQFQRFQVKAWKQYADTAKFRQLQEAYVRRAIKRWGQ
jgi:predicted nucleotidyltransferase